MATETSVDYDRTKELKQFDDTKAGVKGLVDAGILNIPKIFVRPAEDLATEELNSGHKKVEVPIIDVSNIGDSIRRQEIVNEVKIASGEWGFFQVINHGIPLSVLDEMIEGIRLFNEQDLELKKELYSRDSAKKVKFHSNFDLYTSKTADWRDTLQLTFLDSDPDTSQMPSVCRKSTMEYFKHMKKLGETLFELLSEALGLQADHLNSMGYSKGCSIVTHYYPPCPQPELTLGVRKHADAGILTMLLQNHIGGLQVLHNGQWFDIHPTLGGLVLSNDKFKSVKHRAISNHVGPRISVACFFSGHASLLDKPFGPIKKLISEANPPQYEEFLLKEYFAKFFSSSLDTKPPIDYYKLVHQSKLKQFDDTKAGVKGLVDAGILNIPRIFVRPAEDLAADELNSSQKTIEVPIIDVSNIGYSIRRKEIVNEVKIASGEWGFFQVINHGIPLSVLDEMIEGIRLFNEQDLELKKEIYSRDSAKKVKFLSNFDLYTSKALDWKDTLQLSLLDFDPDPSEMPPVCW
ncbi:1-aminocyclopropane-1-carboxylate oxidase-like protein 1-like [Gossypium australe]|uniref:1-aminocyclopropane-1-carboxylate oxidase-like protein 1-like n=1 Tax=Gossypium australe TaxID=47621 RepID=A0A5B6UDE3_9ROSI|nr:1-aminocyclopropane-1-carboxylate oxidase-like protein 1-like [Gossypium australe]